MRSLICSSFLLALLCLRVYFLCEVPFFSLSFVLADDDHKLVSLQVRERADIEYGCKSTLGSLWVATGDSWSAAGGSVNVWKRRFTSLWGVGLLDLRRARDCWIKPTIGNSVSHSKCTDPMHLQTSSACNGLGTSYLQSKQSDSFYLFSEEYGSRDHHA